jgi:multiple sugar transport system substrate-binding protein
MSEKSFSRRKFLRTTLLGAGATIVAACAPTAAPTNAPAPADAGAVSPTTAPPAAQKGGDLRIYWNAGHHYETYKQLALDYEKETGYKINWEIFQWPDMRTKLIANFAAGDVPDISEEAGGWAVEFFVNGNVLSLNPYIDAQGKEMGYPDDWQDVAVKQFKYEDNYVGIKVHHTCTLLFYNKDLFEKGGVNPDEVKTWEDFLGACQATAGGNVFGFAPNQSEGYAWPWFYQNGIVNYNAETNTVNLDHPDAFEALQFQADLIHKHKVAPVPVTSADYEGPQKLFSAGRAAIILTGPWDVKPVLSAGPANWGMIQPLTRKVQATTGAGAGMFIPAKSKNPDAAFEFMRRITALDIEMKATKEANMLMPRKSWAADSEVQAMEYIEPFTRALSLVVDNPELNLTGKTGEVNDLFKQAYSDTIYKNVPASETLPAYAAAANKVLSGS